MVNLLFSKLFQKCKVKDNKIIVFDSLATIVDFQLQKKCLFDIIVFYENQNQWQTAIGLII